MNEFVKRPFCVKCPFCGRTDKIVCCTIAEAEMIEEPIEYQKTHYGVVCDAQIGGCGASTGWNHETPEAAIATWNGSYKYRGSDWIPCSERMPETTEKGLGVLYSDCLLVVSSETGWTAMAYCLTDGEKSWWEFADAQNKIKIDWDEVTHWMPLPKPPKE